MAFSSAGQVPEPRQSDSRRPRERRWAWGWGAGAVLAAFGAALLAGCNHATPAPPAPKPVAVVATRAITGLVQDSQDFTGRLDALKTVDIRARVSGYVKEVPFKEGDVVKAGDLLFQIDPAPYQADLNVAEANVKQAAADRNLQEKNAARARALIGGGDIAREEYDQMQAALEKSKATVGAMQATRDRAKLYLDYTRVVAPLSGRISRRFVDPGNLVTADSTLLTTIVTENPVYAYFDPDERTYLALVESSGPSAWFSGLGFPVQMRLVNEDGFTRFGTVDFVDNRVTATTGTVRMRGVFDNPSGMLKPGMFVRIRLPIRWPYKAVLVPDESLLSDQGRKYVYVINDQEEATYRSVEPGMAVRGLRVIKKGLKDGERVIISGTQRVRRGAAVQAEDQPPPEAPPLPAAPPPSARKNTPATSKPSRAD